MNPMTPSIRPRPDQTDHKEHDGADNRNGDETNRESVDQDQQQHVGVSSYNFV